MTKLEFIILVIFTLTMWGLIFALICENEKNKKEQDKLNNI